jgi:hypothetical protein
MPGTQQWLLMNSLIVKKRNGHFQMEIKVPGRNKRQMNREWE